jgi:pSer/pThr/pTyr-binding forkhead associated (FHA) protein
MPTNLPINPKEPTSNSRSTTEILFCPACGTGYRSGELFCSQCDTVFDQAGRTHTINASQMPPIPITTPRGKLIASRQKPISFEIDGRLITLPSRSDLTVGRLTDHSGDLQPDVDLGSFAAMQKGVSRRHLRIAYKSSIVYISDLNSSNGTWLNGRRLVGFNLSLLHDGDELRLGELRIKVRF